ncbi:MAG: hypothetical protein ABII99_01980 [Patescibacteria group bacterium]
MLNATLVPFAKGERKKIGSENFVFSVLSHRNFRIAERTLSFPLKNAWILAGKYHAEALCAEASNLDFSKCDSWRCFLDEVRTFFEQNPH